MPNAWLSAKNSDLQAFLVHYDPRTTPHSVSSAKTTALFGAMANRDPEARAAIASRLLDDGADPRIVSTGGESSVHALLARRNLTAADADILRRLLDGGADVNLPDSRHSAPLAILYNNGTATDAVSGPLYDVLFARPDLDLDAPASRRNTVRDLLALTPDGKPEFQRRARSYDAERGRTS